MSWGLSWAIWKFRCLWGQILVLTLRAISKLSYQSPSELFNKAMEYPNKLPFCPWYTVKFVRSIRKELTKISNIKTRHWIPPVPSILALFVHCFRLYSTLAFCCTGRRGKCQLNIYCYSNSKLLLIGSNFLVIISILFFGMNQRVLYINTKYLIVNYVYYVCLYSHTVNYRVRERKAYSKI